MGIDVRAVVSGLMAISVSRLIGVASNAVLVPLFLVYWSAGRYGEWLAISSMIAYLSTLDLGVNMAAVNRLTQAYARGDLGAYAAVQRAAMAFYLTVAGVGSVALLGVCLMLPVARLLNLRETDGVEAWVAAWLLGIGLLWAMPTSLLASVYRTTGSLARSQWIGNTQQILTIACTSLVLILGGDFVTLALGQLAILAVGALYAVWDLRRRHPALLVRLGRPDRAIVSELARAGGFFVLIILAGAISTQGMVMIVAASLGGVAVAVFVATRTMANLVRQIVNSAINALWPDITRLEAQGELGRLRGLHFFLVAVSTTLCAAAAGALWFEGVELFRVWTVGALTPDPWLLRWLLVVVIVQVPFSVSLVFPVATNHHRRLATAWLAASVIAVGLGALLVGRLGLLAMPIALLVGEAVGCYHVVVKDVCRLLDESYARFATRVWCGVVGVPAVALAAGWGAHRVVGGPWIVRLAAVGVVCLVAACLATWFVWLTSDERRAWRRRLPPLGRVAVPSAWMGTGA